MPSPPGHLSPHLCIAVSQPWLPCRETTDPARNQEFLPWKGCKGQGRAVHRPTCLEPLGYSKTKRCTRFWRCWKSREPRLLGRESSSIIRSCVVLIFFPRSSWGSEEAGRARLELRMLQGWGSPRQHRLCIPSLGSLFCGWAICPPQGLAFPQCEECQGAPEVQAASPTLCMGCSSKNRASGLNQSWVWPLDREGSTVLGLVTHLHPLTIFRARSHDGHHLLLCSWGSSVRGGWILSGWKRKALQK